MADLQARVLNLVGDVSALLDLAEFRDGLLAALRAELPCDYISLNQVAPEPEQNWSVVQPSLPASLHDTFYRLAPQNPLAKRFLRTRDGRALRLSDIATREQFHATDLYRELYASLGIEHQIAFALPSESQHILAIALSRCEHDFTDFERDLLAVARPHLIQAYRNARQYTDRAVLAGGAPTPLGPDEHTLQLLGLTPAQARTLRLIATGASAVDVARQLEIAPRTVHKHLQRVYRTLGVINRSDAAQRAWQAHEARHSADTPAH